MKSIAENKKTARPIRVIQFGEGGFLRGFADWMLQKLNDKGLFFGGVAVVQPIAKGMCDLLTEQGCMYTHIIRGAEGVERSVIDVIEKCVNPYVSFEDYLALAQIPEARFIISNTTESGIEFKDTDKISDAPSVTFPAKLTLLLKRRFELGLPGFIILPCELIDRNGDNLKRAVLSYARLWGLGEEFVIWLDGENVFCNTLVDRINTGYPRDEQLELGYEDKLVNTSEFFHLWVIETECDIEAELPFSKAGLNVIVTKNELERYRTRKVRILNGAHTSMTPFALLSGLDTVKSCIEDAGMKEFLRACLFDEIIPSLDMSKEELLEYANDVLVRFSNPYIKHYLADISLNSVSKFRVRVLPSLLSYIDKFAKTPKHLVFSLAKLIEFYKNGTPRDSEEIIDYFRKTSVSDILANEQLWGTDLSSLYEEVSQYADTSR